MGVNLRALSWYGCTATNDKKHVGYLQLILCPREPANVISISWKSALLLHNRTSCHAESKISWGYVKRPMKLGRL